MKFIGYFLFSLLFLSYYCSHTSPDILVFSKTVGYRHASIVDGIMAIKKMAEKNQWNVIFSEDADYFTTENLDVLECIVFLNTTQDVLERNHEIAFENYIRNGGGFVGVHAATDTEYDWEFYTKMLGAQFASHPETQEATMLVEKSNNHISTNHLPEKWTKIDEWYNFKNPVADYVHVLLEVDESTIEGETMQGYHPISWFHIFEGGKIFYTALGHTPESYTDELFIKHLEGGIIWSLKE